MRLFKIIILSFYFILESQESYGQTITVLDDLSAFESNGKIQLLWTITSGSTCNGTQIYRSTDSLNYVQIGEIPGICGSTSSARSYTYTDDHPVKNMVNYYRIELGGIGYSGHVSYEVIDFTNKEYQIRPNPVIDQAKLFFSNDKNMESQLIVHNTNGIAILTLITKEAFFEINSDLLLSGIYYFQIATFDNSPITSGKLIVQH